MLSNVTLQSPVSDTWQWHPDIARGYSVRTGYQLLTSQEPPILDFSDNLIWHSQLPLKVSILSWRLIRDRLPTKINLLNRGIISTADTYCSAGCGQLESVQHFFIHCETFRIIWQQVRFLIGVAGVDHHSLHAHFVQFTNYLGGTRARLSFLQLLWLLCVWMVRNERDNRLFNNSHPPNTELIDKVMFHSYWWLKANNIVFVFGCQQWWSDPLTCLSIG